MLSIVMEVNKIFAISGSELFEMNTLISQFEKNTFEYIFFIFVWKHGLTLSQHVMIRIRF